MGFWGGVRRVTAAAVSCALLAQLITVAPAAAAPAPREIVEQRTAYSKVFDNGDGTFKFESYGEPIHYKDETTGRFEPVDNDLVRSTDPAKRGWRNKANGFRVTLPEAMGTDWVSIEAGSTRVSFRPARPLIVLDPAASTSATGVPDPVKHEKLTYASAFGPGVTLEYLSSATGLKETIVLDKYRGKNTFAFELDCGDLSPKMTGDGGIGFYSSESTAPVYTIAPPFMEDSAHNDGDEPARSEDVTYILMPNGATWTLTVAADEEWLTAPTRVWPVKIDPTFFTIGFSVTGDSFVTNQYPNSNYGTSTELKCGYYPGSGENYSYVMPDVGLLMDLRQYASVQIIDANMNMYCSHRYDYGSGPISYGPINAGWGEYSLTWNNQPYATYFGQGTATYLQRTRFPVGTIVQNWMDTGIANGIAFWAPVGGQTTNWTKFASWEAGANGPVFECAFTTRPKVIMTVASDTTSAGAPRLSWTRDDFMYTLSGQPFVSPEQLSADFEIHKEGVSALAYQQSITTTETSHVPNVALSAGRYSVRMRITVKLSDTLITTSDWTAWQPFEVRPLTQGSDGAGSEAYRASDSAGGATIDLGTGRLLLSRSDLSAPALGGAVGASLVYDSAVTSDAVFDGAPGWRVAMPTLGFDDQKAPNGGFETWDAQGMPTGWSRVESGTNVASSTAKRSGTYSMKISRTTAGNTQVRMTDAIPVVAGQQLEAVAWVKTSALVAGSGGMQTRIAYFDEYGNYTGVYVPSSVLTEATSPEWRNVALKTKVPAGAASARLYIGLYNCYGSIYVDDVYFGDSTLRLVDSDGTGRTFASAGDGLYQRDPLAGTLALKRTNVATGIVPTLVGTGGVTGASTDGSYAITSTSGWDYVYNGTDASFTYDLGEARVLSEARLLLWDGANVGETSPRTHSYKLQYSTTGEAGSYHDLTGAITGARSWQTHYFAPVKARYFRVANVNSTSGAFVLCELELPVTTLSETPIAFDAAGRVRGIADAAGNIISYSYDDAGHLAAVADTAERRVDLNWGTDGLTSLDLVGVGSTSSTPAAEETGIVRYSVEGSSLLIERKDDEGTYVTVATYTYSGGRIASVTDADGVSATIGYAAGRVSTIARSDESTTTYTYGADVGSIGSVTITTAGGAESISRRVEFDRALGCQVTKTVTDPAGAALETLYAYDTYGHIASTTSGRTADDTLRVDTYTCDAHGNMLSTTANSTGTGDLKLTTTATYTNDRVASSTDAKGNVSNTMYDAKWRPLSSTVAVTSSAASGESVTESAYDEWGNVTGGQLPGSSVSNLIENGTFERNPWIAGNGWTCYGNLNWTDATTGQAYLGDKMLTSGSGTPWAASDLVAVTPSETYIASAWCRSGGRIGVAEYTATGAFLRRKVLVTVPNTGTTELSRISSVYVPPADVGKVAFELGLDGVPGAAFDNARFEKAYAAGPDNFIDNDSFERLVGASPESWAAYYGADDVADVVASGTEHLLRLAGGPGATGTPWWESAPVAVDAAAPLRVTASVAADHLTSGGGGYTGVEVCFFKDASCTWGTGEAGPRVRLTGNASLTGTKSFTTYSMVIDPPDGALYAKVCPELGLAHGTLLVDHVTMEPTTARETYEYDDTHTYRTSTTTLAGAEESTVIDSRGRAVSASHTDPGAATATVETKRTYDDFDRLTNVETAPNSDLGITAAFTYTDAGRLKTVTDPLDHVTTIGYDESGRIKNVTTPSGLTTAMTYDGLGRLATTTAPYKDEVLARTLVANAYDTVGRLASTTYYAEDGSVAATQTVTYDSLSRQKNVSWAGPEAQGQLTYTYDGLGRVTGLVSDGPAVSASFTTTYDKASLPLTTSFSAFGLSEVNTITNTYAKTGQWQTTKTAGSQEWTFTTGTDGTFRRAASDRGSRVLAYDTSLRLIAVRLAAGSVTAEETLSYDGHSRVSGAAMTSSAAALCASDTYDYDEASRLERWTHTASGVTGETLYTHDAAGNLKVVDRPGADDDSILTYGTDNELETLSRGGETTTYEHDDFGRRRLEETPEGDITYTWNALGQLSGVSSADATATFTYGPSGMREEVTVESAEGTTTTQAVWGGGRLLAERDSDGKTYRYLYGPDGLPLELIVTTGSTTEAYTYLCDRAGSVVALADDTGALVATYTYDPWGVVTSVVDVNESGLAERNPLRYRGYYYDEATGLYYLPARYYDPAVARFLSVDPAPPEADNPLSLNSYSYCFGDPVNLSDPSGADPPNKGIHKVGSKDYEDWQKYLKRKRAIDKIKKMIAERVRVETGIKKGVGECMSLLADASGIAAQGLGSSGAFFGGLWSWKAVFTTNSQVSKSHDNNDATAEALLDSAIRRGDDDAAQDICTAAQSMGDSANPPYTPTQLRTGYLETGVYSHDQVIGWIQSGYCRSYDIGRLEYFNRGD